MERKPLVELELEVPCGSERHPVRIGIYGWRDFEVLWSPCDEALGEVFGKMAPCKEWVRYQLPEKIQDDSQFRRQIVEMLSKVGKVALPLLIESLKDKDKAVRSSAIWVLGEIGDPQAVPALIEALKESYWDLYKATVDLFSLRSAPEEVEEQVMLVKHFIRELRSSVGEALRKIGKPAVIALMELIQDSDWAVREDAAWLLGMIGDCQAVPTLIKALYDTRSCVRKTAASALVQIGNPAVSALIDALKDSNEDVRQKAAEALGEIKAPQAVPALIEMLKDRNRNVRCWSAWALGMIGDSQAVPALIETLKDRNRNPTFLSTPMNMPQRERQLRRNSSPVTLSEAKGLTLRFFAFGSE